MECGWQSFYQFIIHPSTFSSPHTGEGGLDLLLEAGNQFPIGGDERLLGFDLGDDLLPDRELP